MWSKNPFGKDGWWGKEGNWYNAGYCRFTYWATEQEKGGYRNVNFVHPFIEMSDKVYHFNQIAAFHGAIPNPGFPPLSFYPQS